ncbi:ABC transporter permease [Deferribacteres bacterium DY0037]
MLLKLRAMLIKELKQMLRDPKMRMVVLGVPMVQMFVMSFALTLDVKNIDIGVLDMDKSKTTTELVSKLGSSGYFKITRYTNSFKDIHDMLDKGEIRGAVIFQTDTEKKLLSNQKADIQIIADGTMSNDAGIIFSYMNTLLNEYNIERLYRLTGSDNMPVVFNNRNLFNQNLDSSLYYVPGLIVMMIMITSILLTSIAIVREKEIGTIEQVMVTPIGRLEFIIGKTVPFFITGYATTALMFVIAFMVFDVVIKGSLILLGLIVGLNILAYLGLALLISASAYTQQQALLTAFFIMMPCALLSGFLFPIDNMPIIIQYLTVLDPMRWGFESIIGVVSKGAGVYELYQPLLWQASHAVFFIVLASIRFKKTLE